MKWTNLIYPHTANIILGKRGSGKSGLGYFLVEEISQKYNLLPRIANYPQNKRYLLPPEFDTITLDDLATPNTVILIDEGTTFLPAGGAKLEEMVKGCQALVRQRNQVILFVFHASSDVGSRILRGMDCIMVKKPSSRQIRWGSKDEFCRELLIEAREKIHSKKQTLVECEEPEFRGIMTNKLPSFWSEELSEVWRDATSNEKLGQERVNMLKASAPQSKGTCCICGKYDNLFSGTCEKCFLDWVNGVFSDGKKRIP